MLLALSLACAPAFDQTRKDLEDFRLVGMRWVDPEGAPEAAVWSGEGAFHTTAPAVTWSTAGAEASVRVESADGAVEEGVLVRGADATSPVVEGFTRIGAGESWSIAVGVEESDDAVTRWMASGGTFTETGPHSAEWVAEDAPLTTIFALTLDGKGGNTWTWIDVATDDATYLAVGGRLLPVEGSVVTGDVLATLTAAEDHAGLVLTDLAEAGDDAGDSVCGLDPFDADALVDGRCGLDEALGARVRLSGAAWP